MEVALTLDKKVVKCSLKMNMYLVERCAFCTRLMSHSQKCSINACLMLKYAHPWIEDKQYKKYIDSLLHFCLAHLHSMNQCYDLPSTPW